MERDPTAQSKGIQEGEGQNVSEAPVTSVDPFSGPSARTRARRRRRHAAGSGRAQAAPCSTASTAGGGHQGDDDDAVQVDRVVALALLAQLYSIGGRRGPASRRRATPPQEGSSGYSTAGVEAATRVPSGGALGHAQPGRPEQAPRRGYGRAAPLRAGERRWRGRRRGRPERRRPWPRRRMDERARAAARLGSRRRRTFDG